MTIGLEISAAELKRWPEPERRHPSRSDRHYLVLAELARQLRQEINRLFEDRSGLRVLDIGCGNKPYLPLVAESAASHFGVDAVDGPMVDAVGVGEDLPCQDASFDLVLCTQVLEHVDDPPQVLSEIERVLAPGGAALLSTHGVFLYHPDPPPSDRDYWRWTHSGLRRIFRRAGDWRELSIQPQGNIVACLGYLIAQFVDEAGQKVPVPFLGRSMLWLVNSVSEWIDQRFPPSARVPAGGSLSANYLVTAVKK